MTDVRSAPPIAVDVTTGPRPRCLPVCLIRPPVVTLPDSLATHGPTPPIGLAYVAATLRSAGHDVVVIDAPGEAILDERDIETPVGPLTAIGLSETEIVARIPPEAAIIGVTLMFMHEWPTVRALLARIRNHHPDAKIVLGGETPTAFWTWMFGQTDAIDAVVLGEGEQTMVELARRIACDEPIVDMQGVVAPDADGVPRSGGLPTRNRSLGSIPVPAWDLLPIDRYWDHPYFGVDRGRSMPVMATRGCPYKCSFCSSPQMWTTRYVTRDPKDVVDEIESHVELYGVRNINFCDLTAITKRRWTLDFCDELDARGLAITWQLPVGTRAEALDAEVLQRMHDTGCRNITYAPESGSKRMLEVYDKKVDLDHILSSIRHASQIGLRTHTNIIVGHPAERWADVGSSLRFLLRAAIAGCDDAAVIIFCPYPGSADFDRLVEHQLLEVDETACYLALTRSSSLAASFNDQLSARTLRWLQLSMMGVFYGVTVICQPTRLLQFVRMLLGGRELTYLDQMVRTRRQARRRRDTRVPARPLTAPVS